MATTSAASHLRFSTRRLMTGPLIHAAEQGDPSGEVVIFIHGWPDSWFSWSRVLGLLSPAYHAYALDLRGFGSSERPTSDYSIESLAADVLAFMDAVDVRRATLVGHSMGSFVARCAAVLEPSRISGLVLIGSAVEAANDVTREVQEIVRSLTDPLPESFVREFQGSTICVPVPDTFFDGIVAASHQAPARVWQSVLEGLFAYDDADRLGQINAPTLLLWGDQDALFPGEAGQQRLLTAIPDAQLTVLRETGHSPNWERPERVVARLEAFLTPTRGARPPHRPTQLLPRP